MAKYRFRGSLSSARWPLIAALQGRTVIEPTYDIGNRIRKNQQLNDEGVNLTEPQIIYCENVVPTNEGYMSVGYSTVATGGVAAADFDQAITLRDEVENNYVYAPAHGKNYILNNTTLVWASTNPIAVPDGTQVSRAYVNGRTLICYAGLGIFEYLPGANTFLAVVGLILPPGVVIADVRGIGASNNYLIIFTDITIYWGSLTNPVDFTPSTTTGAGSATPQDVKGRINAIQATGGGFIIWTSRNAVAAQYTNNVRAPFAFKEVAGAGGLIKNEHLTQDATSGVQYAWTTGGLQKVTLQLAEPLSVEVSDFLAGRLYLRWNLSGFITTEAGINITTESGEALTLFDTASANNFTTVVVTQAEFNIKLVLVSNRFLCISWSDTKSGVVDTFTFCLVYDTGLKRWGQFKIPHVDVFSLSIESLNTSSYQTFTDLGTTTFTGLGTKTFNDLLIANFGAFTPTSKRSLAFLQQDGAIQLALMDYNKSYNHNGVIIFGRFQLVRQKLMTHQLTTVESVYGFAVSGTASFSAYLMNSLDGYNFQSGIVMPVHSTTGARITYENRITGINYNLVCIGTFALSTYLMEVSQDGSD